MFKSLSLRVKILMGFLLICIGLVVISVISVKGERDIVKDYKIIAENSMVSLGHISGMRARSRQIYADVLKLALYNDKPELLKATHESFEKGHKRYQEIEKEYLQAKLVDGEQEYYDKMAEKSKLFLSLASESYEISKSSDSAKVDKLNALFQDKIEAAVKEHQTALLALDDFVVENGDKLAKAANETASKTEKFIIYFSLVIVAMAMLIAYVMATQISNKVNEIASVLDTSSDQVAKHSGEVSKAASDLSSSSVEQASALQQTVAAASEVSAMIQKTAENSVQTLQKADASKIASNNGKESVRQVVVAIDEIENANHAINKQVENSNKEISEIVNMIQHISEKTKVINDIVFQTKLLSFNASVEAARAGEQGKGFAVVAEEVSNLANMSGKAAQEISLLLSESTSKVEDIVKKTQSSVAELVKTGQIKIESGKKIANSCDGAIDEIVTYVDDMYSMVKEISRASQEQAIGISEINKAMDQMDLVTTQNSNTAQVSSHAASELENQAMESKALVNKLVAIVRGESKEIISSYTYQEHESSKDRKNKLAA